MLMDPFEDQHIYIEHQLLILDNQVQEYDEIFPYQEVKFLDCLSDKRVTIHSIPELDEVEVEVVHTLLILALLRY